MGRSASAFASGAFDANCNAIRATNRIFFSIFLTPKVEIVGTAEHRVGDIPDTKKERAGTFSESGTFHMEALRCGFAVAQKHPDFDRVRWVDR